MENLSWSLGEAVIGTRPTWKASRSIHASSELFNALELEPDAARLLRRTGRAIQNRESARLFVLCDERSWTVGLLKRARRDRRLLPRRRHSRTGRLLSVARTRARRSPRTSARSGARVARLKARERRYLGEAQQGKVSVDARSLRKRGNRYAVVRTSDGTRPPVSAGRSGTAATPRSRPPRMCSSSCSASGDAARPSTPTSRRRPRPRSWLDGRRTSWHGSR